MGIKHRADSGFRKFWVLSKLCLGEQSTQFRNALHFIPEPLLHAKTACLQTGHFVLPIHEDNR